MIERRNGTYGSIKYCESTVQEINRWMDDHNIPNRIDDRDIHTTLIYSRVKLAELENAETYRTLDSKFKVSGFDKFGDALVMLIEAPELVELHESLKKDFGATHDYEDYRPHVTLSYGIDEGFDLNSLNLPSFELHPSFICFEPLDDDWEE